MLETVIPRQSDGVVCIVLGKYKGQLGRLVEKNKSKCQAVVQLLRDQTAVKLNYDQIAEYTGDLETLDDY
jgi:G patch domain/KOW motif-containing protein